MKKRNILMIISIVILFLVFVIMLLSFNRRTDKIVSQFEYVKLSNDLIKIEDESSSYEDQIITNNVLEYDYEIIKENSNLYGRIYIENSFVYVSNDLLNTKHKVSNEKFVTLYMNYSNKDSLVVYGLSNNNEVYKFELDSTDIEDVKDTKLNLNEKIKSFVRARNSCLECTTVFASVLSESNKVLVADNGLLLSDSYMNLYNRYLIDVDRNLYNINGRKIVDSKKNNIKISKYIILNDVDDKYKLILISDNNEMLFLYDNDTIAIYNNKITTIFNGNDEVNITLDNKFNIKLNGQYYDYK